MDLNTISVFLGGLISFLSPCIIPVLPVYLAILAGSQTGEIEKGQKNTLIKNTILFVLGVSTTFFLLGNSIKFLSDFIFDNKQLLMIIGGSVIVVMGLLYMGAIQIPALQREKRFRYQVNQINAGTAFILGLTFSLGWTPCIGPMLTSVMIMTSNTDNVLQGNILIGVYTLGFMIPFLLLAFFSKRMLRYMDKLKPHMGKVQKIGGLLLIAIGVLMMTGTMEKWFGTGVFLTDETKSQEEQVEDQTSVDPAEETEEESDEVIPPDFTLVDQNGETHTLSDYKGKTVFLNFWATWCPPCLAEMPHIQKMYEEYGENKEDVIILGVAFPEIGREGDTEHIKSFLGENKYSFPVVFDEKEDDYELAYFYGIQAFPTTILIGPDGYVDQYIPGGLTEEMMKELIEASRE